MNYISSVPSDIMIHIFSYLTPKDLVGCTSVCRIWNEYGARDCLWKGLFHYYHQHVDHLPDGHSSWKEAFKGCRTRVYTAPFPVENFLFQGGYLILGEGGYKPKSALYSIEVTHTKTRKRLNFEVPYKEAVIPAGYGYSAPLGLSRRGNYNISIENKYFLIHGPKNTILFSQENEYLSVTCKRVDEQNSIILADYSAASMALLPQSNHKEFKVDGIVDFLALEKSALCFGYSTNKIALNLFSSNFLCTKELDKPLTALALYCVVHIIPLTITGHADGTLGFHFLTCKKEKMHPIGEEIKALTVLNQSLFISTPTRLIEYDLSEKPVPKSNYSIGNGIDLMRVSGNQLATISPDRRTISLRTFDSEDEPEAKRARKA